jgi:hypothetical protein
MNRPLGRSVATLGVTTLGLLALLVFRKSPEKAAAVHRSDALPPTGAEPAYFQVGFPPEDLAFTIMLTDTATIQEARDIIRGVQSDRVRVMGTIIKAAAVYNPPWSYHLDPPSIEFFQFAVEVCDAHPQYVEENLQEACGAFLPGCVWCPYSSKVVAEVDVFERYLPMVTK